MLRTVPILNRYLANCFWSFQRHPSSAGNNLGLRLRTSIFSLRELVLDRTSLLSTTFRRSDLEFFIFCVSDVERHQFTEFHEHRRRLTICKIMTCGKHHDYKIIYLIRGNIYRALPFVNRARKKKREIRLLFIQNG